MYIVYAEYVLVSSGLQHDILLIVLDHKYNGIVSRGIIGTREKITKNQNRLLFDARKTAFKCITL